MTSPDRTADETLLRSRLITSRAQLVDMTPAELLHLLSQTQYLVDLLNIQLDDVAEALRQRQVSWTEIAMATGVTQQAAHKRWAPEAQRKRNELRDRKKKRLEAAAAPAATFVSLDGVAAEARR